MKPSTYLKKVGPYCLIREIGVGSFARVYKGRVEGSSQDVAIKMIFKQNVKSENLSIIEKEIEILEKLDHPNIIKLLDFKKTSNHYYLIFEFCEHGDLDNYIRKYADNGKLPEKEVKKIGHQLALALEKMHNLRIVHRDLKLANILVSKQFQIKLADFGFAKYNEEDTFLTSYCGTPLTMAPEILKREKYNDKCDIWSVGVIMYQMLFGKAPFLPPKGGNINDLIKVIDTTELKFPEQPEISLQLKSVISSMLQKDYRKRMTCQQYFNNPWFKDQSVDGLFLQSLCPVKIEQPVEQIYQFHKVSEDINDDELIGEKDEMLSPTIREYYLKYISTQLRRQIIKHLDVTLMDIAQINDFADRIANQKVYTQTVQQKINSLSLAVRLYAALKLCDISEFMKEQVVVLHTQASNIGLINLQVKKPLEGYEIELQKQTNKLKQYFIESPENTQSFQVSGLSIADNIYDEFVTLMINLVTYHHKIDKCIIEEMFQLLKSFIAKSPQMQTVELYINLQTGNDMNYYWNLFKLVRVDQQTISELIEKSVTYENAEFDRKLTFDCRESVETFEPIGFTLDNLNQIQQNLD